MSLYADLENRCKRRLGRRGFNITNEFLDEMKAAQEKLEMSPQLPKILKKTTAPISTPQDATTLTSIPPTDFIRVYDDFGLLYVDDAGNEKGAKRLDTRQQLISKKNAGISGEIYYFVVSNAVIEIAPKLSRATLFTMTYYAKDVVLTGANENLWTGNFGELILGMAGTEIANWLRDDRALQYFQGLAQTERRRMVLQVEADEWGDTDLTMGGPD